VSRLASTFELQRTLSGERYAWLWDVGCLLGGAMAVLGFAPYDWRWFAVLGLAILCLAVMRDPVRRACRRGWLFGLGYFGVGVSWIQISIHQFGLPVLAFSVSATLLFVAFVALFPALFAWAARQCAARQCAARWSGFQQSLVLAALWTLVEWSRSWFLTGFPWLTIGYSQTTGWLNGYAPLGGVFAVSFLLAWSAAVLGLVRDRALRIPVLLLLLAVWGGGWALRQIAWTSPKGEPIDVVLVQGNVAQSMKWQPSERDASIRTYLRLTEPYWGRSALIIWPETAVPALYEQAHTLFEQLQVLAQRHGTDLLIGVPYRDAATGRFYNSAVSLGQTPGVYHKRHLVPFGEYMPFKPMLGPLLDFLNIPMSDFSGGPWDQPDLRVAQQGIGLSICYEDVFGDEVIRALPAADLLINISNDAWFGDSFAPHQHLQMARMRAIETGRYMLRATNTGVTAVVDPKGQLLASAPQFEATALSAKAQAQQGMTPYARTGNLPLLALLAIIVLLALRQSVSVANDAVCLSK
jgi:apolipoprotein N-acyltransferase